MKWTVWLALASLAVAMLGCKPGDSTDSTKGSDTGTTGKSTPPEGKKITVGVVFDSGGLGDKSFNDSAWAGVQRAVTDFGVVEKHVESKSVKDIETNLQTLADQGCDIVFAIGINQKDSLEKVAAQYPDTKFGIVDAVPNADLGLKNVRAMLFKEEEGSFLAGYLAGLMTKTNKLGFVGGMEIDLIKKFYAGYAAGAKTANPAIEILPAKYTGDWNNVDLAKAAANLLFDSGADVVYHAAGRAGLGVLDAAKEKGKWGIGVDGDQDGVAEGSVLTSMIKHVDEAVYSTIKDVQEGKFSTGEVVYDLKVGGVGLSPMQYTKDKVGEDKLKKVDEIKQKIVSGEIKVPSTIAELESFKPQ